VEHLGRVRLQLIAVQVTDSQRGSKLLGAAGELRVGSREPRPLLLLPVRHPPAVNPTLDELPIPGSAEKRSERLSQ
jgi:hypothetical protein